MTVIKNVQKKTQFQPTKIPFDPHLLREGFNKKKHSFYGIFHNEGGGVHPFSITLFWEKNISLKKIFKDAQKLLIQTEM